MTLFFQSAAAALIGVVLSLCLEKQGKDAALMLILSVCVMIAAAAISYLKPVLDFLTQLQSVGNLNQGMVTLLLKIMGIGLLSEIVSMVCVDAGRASLGKSLQFLSSGVILWISIPIFQGLLGLIQDILGNL